ncbi:Signal transduction histidine kinase CheA [Chitinispirillum alkaliphilum]|nr:Signal transduction histidine kinase CheA [Chitinispirillum alkaliphilum]
MKLPELRFKSFKEKLLFWVISLSTIAFLVLIGFFVLTSVSRNLNQLAQTKDDITTNIISKGRLLTFGHAMSLENSISDFAYADIRRLVSSTVESEEDLRRGIVTDSELGVFAYYVEGSSLEVFQLEDDLTVYLSNKTEMFDTLYYCKELGEEVYEFYSPVSLYGEIIGHCRYAYSAAPLRVAIKEAQRNARAELYGIVFGSLLIAALVILLFVFIMSRVAGDMVRPITSLVSAAKVIAKGDYSQEVKASTEDEIGELASNFNTMRLSVQQRNETIKRFQSNLLGNIDQGLLVVKLDMSIAAEYSLKTNEILETNDVTSESIYTLLRLNDEKSRKAFDTWFNTVKNRMSNLKWSKLEKLSPVHELELNDMNGNAKYVRVSYKPVLNSGVLEGVMLLVSDCTQIRKQEEALRLQQLRHENEMHIVLGIAKSKPSEIDQVIDDTKERINRVENILCHLNDKVCIQRDNHPDPNFVFDIETDVLDTMYREMHTVKGNGGSYGFDLITELAHNFETLISDLREKTEIRRDLIIDKMFSLIKEIEKEFVEVNKLYDMLNKNDTSVINVPTRIHHTLKEVVASAVVQYPQQKTYSVLKELVEKMTWARLDDLVSPFRKALLRAAEKVDKTVTFEVMDPDELYPAELFSKVTKSLGHIIRNSVDHGVETDEFRQESGKGSGVVSFSVDYSSEETVVRISDNGKGIDPEQIIKKAVEKKIISSEEASLMSPEEILNIIFRPGFSTAQNVTDISGRGVGMDVVKSNLNEIGGSIRIESVLGEGTTFILVYPS